MPMTIRLETESKGVLGDVFDRTLAIVTLAHEVHSQAPLGLLQFVNPWGDTVFNELQMPTVLRDLDRLREKARSEEDREVLLGVEKLAKQGMNDHHVYLWFYGD